jgi:hypothetical protein
MEKACHSTMIMNDFAMAAVLGLTLLSPINLLQRVSEDPVRREVPEAPQLLPMKTHRKSESAQSLLLANVEF